MAERSEHAVLLITGDPIAVRLRLDTVEVI